MSSALRLSTLSFFFFIGIVSAVVQDKYDVELRTLRSAFGANQMETHFANNPAVYKNALNRKLLKPLHPTSELSESSYQNSNSVYVACCNYDGANKVLLDLQDAFGENNVQTVYVSRSFQSSSEGEVCFLLSLPPGSIQSRPEGLTVWSPFLDDMKIDAYLVDNLLSWDPAENITSYDLNMRELEVVFGLGSGKGMHRSSEDILASIKESTKQIDSIAAVNKMFLNMDLSGSTKTSRMWIRSKAATDLSLSSSSTTTATSNCNFDMLTYEVRAYSILIGNLESWSKSSSFIRCMPLLVAMYAQNANVQHINMVLKNKPVNEVVNKYLQVGDSSSTRYSSVGLKGSGIVIGVADTGVDELSCYFSNSDNSIVARQTSNYVDNSKRKIIQYYNYADSSDDVSGHGTHVCGTIAGCNIGTSNGGNLYDGLAPNAKIALFDVGVTGAPYLSIPALNTVFDAAAFAGANLHSNSWGGGTSYTSFCVDSDNYLTSNPNFLIFFAAGNEGASATPGVGTVISPGLSKNVLTVGAGGSGHGAGINTVAYFSSQGPTPDGRYGIDVIAQGYNTYSAYASVTTTSCLYTSKSGTSMATPAVAAAAALVTQYFKDSSFWASYCNPLYSKCGVLTPSGSLIKAVLIHSGQNMGGGLAWPGNIQGFGRIQLNTVLQYPGISGNVMLYVDDVTLSQATRLIIPVTVASSDTPLKVTITWMDPVNSVSAAKQLLNDIDLSVLGPYGNKYYGNNNPAEDSLNNAEMVYISSPVPGNYNISIITRLFVNNSPQTVSIVVTCNGNVLSSKSSSGYYSSPPTQSPTLVPTSPSLNPTLSPTKPTLIPSRSPTLVPSKTPTLIPSRPTAIPTQRPSRPTTTPTQVPTRTMDCNDFEFELQLVGGQTFCAITDATGNLNSFVLALDFSSASTSNWASDFAVGVYDPITQNGLQVGGYGGFKLFTNAVPVPFPSAWDVGNAGFYYATINTSSFTVQSSFQLCYANGWLSTTVTSKYKGRMFLNKLKRNACNLPSVIPTSRPSTAPSFGPTKVPSLMPTVVPTRRPTSVPSTRPSDFPTYFPTANPTDVPTFSPSVPTELPTFVPTVEPTITPPTIIPTNKPSFNPTTIPTIRPTRIPTCTPITLAPVNKPTGAPLSTRSPTRIPTRSPNRIPTSKPVKKK